MILIVVIAIVVLLAGGLFVGGFFAMSTAREAARRSQCSNNLKQIGLAIHNYHDSYNSLPAAVLTDQDGRPMRSWRVAVLPYLESTTTHDRYDYNEPWNSPANQSLESAMPYVYRCPSDDRSGPWDTSYLMIAQEEWDPQTRVRTMGGPPNRGSKFADIKDGTSNTILVVETAGAGIHWMEPRDLTYEEIDATRFAVNDPSGNGIQGVHPGGVNVLMGDATVTFLSETTDPEVLRRLLNADDGEPVSVPY